MTQRYWDGNAWTSWVNAEVPAGQKIQAAGQGISRIGASLMWITIGVIALVLIALVI